MIVTVGDILWKPKLMSSFMLFLLGVVEVLAVPYCSLIPSSTAVLKIGAVMRDGLMVGMVLTRGWQRERLLWHNVVITANDATNASRLTQPQVQGQWMFASTVLSFPEVLQANFIELDYTHDLLRKILSKKLCTTKI